MRSLWNGSISFGLVNIPVKLYAGTASEDLRVQLPAQRLPHPHQV